QRVSVAVGTADFTNQFRPSLGLSLSEQRLLRRPLRPLRTGPDHAEPGGRYRQGDNYKNREFCLHRERRIHTYGGKFDPERRERTPAALLEAPAFTLFLIRSVLSS